MGFKDLRSFLKKLEEEKQLIHFTDMVKPSPDIGRASAAISKNEAGGAAVMFENIEGYKGKKLVVGVHGSWANSALSFGMPKTAGLKDQFFTVAELFKRYNEGSVIYVDNAPCHENVIEGSINLYEILPLYRINHLDGGFYLSKACVVTSEPYDWDNLSATNVGTYRLQVQGPDTLGLQLGNFHDGGEHFAQAVKEGRPLPVCICLGNDPLLSFMASTPVAYNESEYLYVSAMGGFPYELTRSCVDGLPIPANCEYVLEGEIMPFEKTVEGPFGEFPGSYSGVRNQLLIKIKKVTHRNDPIFENLYIGFPWTEADTLMAINTCVPVYDQVKKEFPGVVAINAIYQHGLTTICSCRPRIPGQAKTIAMRICSTPHGNSYCRNVIMVDAEVNPFNLTEVMWALSTRVRGREDITIIEGVPGIRLLPMVDASTTDRKLIIDATTPVAPEKFAKDCKLVMPDPEVEKWVSLLAEMQSKL